MLRNTRQTQQNKPSEKLKMKFFPVEELHDLPVDSAHGIF